MRIAVNTRLLLPGKLEGIGWFAHETLSRIVVAHPEHKFIFLFDRPYDRSFVYADNVEAVVVPPPTRHPLLYRLWFQFALPRALRRNKADVFLSPDGFLSTRTAVPQLAVMHDLNFEHYPEDLPAAYSTYCVLADGAVEEVLTWRRLKDAFDADLYCGVNDLTGARFFLPMRRRPT